MERLGFSKVTSRRLSSRLGFASAEPDTPQTHRKQTRFNSNLLTTEDTEPRSKHGTEHTNTTRTFNVVLFGETGVGKSSVINLIAQKDIAKVSTDIDGCTMQSTRYDIRFDGMDFSIFDTIGLEEPHFGVNGYLRAIEKAYELITRLSAAGGIHLLLFCLRGGRITATAQSNYRLFCECLCSSKVPIALVFTGLEMEDRMENWWERNKIHVEHYGIRSVGHACITAVQDDTPEQILKYTESKRAIRDLLKNHALKGDAFSPEAHSWFARLGGKMKSFIAKRKNPKKKDIMKILTQRCKLDPDTAKRIVDMMEKEDKTTDEQKNATGASDDTQAGVAGTLAIDGYHIADQGTDARKDDTQTRSENPSARAVAVHSVGGMEEGYGGERDTDDDASPSDQLANIEFVLDESQVAPKSFAEDHPLPNHDVGVEAGPPVMNDGNEVATTEPPFKGMQGEGVQKMNGGRGDDAQLHSVGVRTDRMMQKDASKPLPPVDDKAPRRRGTGERAISSQRR